MQKNLRNGFSYLCIGGSSFELLIGGIPVILQAKKQEGEVYYRNDVSYRKFSQILELFLWVERNSEYGFWR